MFDSLLKSVLAKTESSARCLLVFSGLMLFTGAADGGVYQRTKDGKTLVWNNFPSKEDAATWTGKRDRDGYATGSGTLTWYRTEGAFQTGSLLPTNGGPVTVVTRYSGTMVRGKFNGPVTNVDPDGKTMQLMFVDGAKSRKPVPRPSASPEPAHNEHAHAVAAAPAEGPKPTPMINQSITKAVPEEAKVELPPPTLPSPPAAKSKPPPPMVEVASIRTMPQAPAPSSSPSADELEAAIKERMVVDFKEETQAVLSQVSDATDNFHGVEKLDAVGQLPEHVSESVTSLVQRARDFRAKIGYETALRNYRAETQTVDALSTIEQVTRSIATNDALAANAKLADFLKANPEPTAENQKPLWQYLGSMEQICSRSEREAEVHLKRAESFAAASRNNEAIREYQEAYRAFPNPAIWEKIRQLQANSLGL